MQPRPSAYPRGPPLGSRARARPDCPRPDRRDADDDRGVSTSRSAWSKSSCDVSPARDARCQALQTIFGVGPIYSCHLLAEIGNATRFKRSRQVVRASGLDPAVIESADNKRRGRLAKQGSPHLRWALVEAANHSSRASSPDHALYMSTAARCGRGRARPPSRGRSPAAPTTCSQRSKPRALKHRPVDSRNHPCERLGPHDRRQTCDALPRHLARRPSCPVGE